MPLPTAGDLHVNRPLTNILVAYMQDPGAFVADRVFPNVPVEKQGDLFTKYDRSYFYRTEMQLRADGAESVGVGFGVSNDNYFCPIKAEHKMVSDRQRANSDAPINLDRAATKLLGLHAKIRRELDWVTDFFGTTIWTGSTTGTDITPGTLWSAAGSTPLEDIEEQKAAVEKTGYSPNKFVMGRHVWAILKNHAQILERIKYTQGGTGGAKVSLELLASLLEVDECMVARGAQNTAAEGAPEVLSFIADEHDALLVYAAPEPQIEMPSGGYTFSWAGAVGAGAQGERIKKFRMEELASDRIEIEMAWVPKLVAAELGTFFDEVTAL